MIKLAFFAILLFGAVTALAQEPAKKLPPPAAAALKDAAATLDDVYKADLAAAKTPEAKQALAQKLLDASGHESDLTAQFALLTRAKDVAADAGDYAIASAAIAQLGQLFDIDSLKLAWDAASPAMRNSHTAAQKRDLAAGMADLAQKAIAADRYDLGKQAADLSVAAARSASSLAALRQATAMQQSVQEAASAYADLKPSLAVLAKQPSDPAANLAIGRFRCFFKADWEGGLPMLAQGNDASLKSIAEKELAGAPAAGSQRALADAWWDLAAKQKGLAQEHIQQHAAKWYKLALPELTGLPKTAAEKRVAEVEHKGDAGTQNQIVVEALIDGNSELHVTPTGIYWKHLGSMSKPGMHSRNNLPTYVNHTAWMPEWGRPASTSAADQSKPYPLNLGKLGFSVETLAVGGGDNDKTPDKIQGIEPRDPVFIVDRDQEQVVSIPDRQFGAKWYRIRIYRKG